MRPLRVLQLESPNLGGQGDHVYRTLQPCRALGTFPGWEVTSGSLLSPRAHDLLASADLVILCDVVDVDLIRVVEQRRARGQATVYEINDHFRAPQTWNRTAYLADNLLTRSLSAQLAAMADLVQFTCPALDEIFGELNPRRAIFGNHLWSLPPPRPPRPGDSVTLGWGGSLGHLADLEWVMPVLRAVIERHPEVKLGIMAPDTLANLFDWVPAGRLRFRPGGNVEAYYQFLDTLDIGICPLLPTPFNRCRTDVKLLELSAHGVVPVCSDLDPYRPSIRSGDNGVLFSNLAELERALSALVADAGLRQAMAVRARAFAEGRVEIAHVGARAEVYRALCAGISGDREPLTPTLSPEWRGRKNAFERGATIYPGSSYRPLAPGELEERLYRGLRLFREGQAGAAVRELRAAQKLAPEFFVPHLYEGTMEPDPRRALAACRRAADRNAESAGAALAAAACLEKLGQFDQARAELHRCLALAPKLGAAQARLADLCERQGDTPGAVMCLAQADDANPHFIHPGLRLALAALEAGEPGRAASLAGAAAERDPDHYLPRFLLGRAALLAGDSGTAIAHLERALEGAADPAPVLAQLAKAYAHSGDLTSARALISRLRGAA